MRRRTHRRARRTRTIPPDKRTGSVRSREALGERQVADRNGATRGGSNLRGHRMPLDLLQRAFRSWLRQIPQPSLWFRLRPARRRSRANRRGLLGCDLHATRHPSFLVLTDRTVSITAQNRRRFRGGSVSPKAPAHTGTRAKLLLGGHTVRSGIWKLTA